MALAAALGEPEALAQLEAPGDTDVRWAVHRTAGWQASPLAKVRACHRYAHDHESGTVPLRGRPNADGGLDVGFGNLKTCACWHSCLVCGVRIAIERARELEHALRVWHALGGYVLVVTLSARHHKGMALEQLVRGQRAGWGAVVSDRPWKRDRERLGIRYVIRGFEATHGDEHGWHPHFHVYLFCDPRWTTTRELVGERIDGRGKRRKVYRNVTRAPWERPDGTRCEPSELPAPAPLPDPATAEELLGPLWGRWCEGLAAEGMSAVDYVTRDGMQENAGFHVAVMDLSPGSTGVASYPFKLALEGVGAIFKRGGRHDREGREQGRRHRTPFEVMESYAVARSEGDLEGAEEDRRIIAEWSQTATDMRFRQAPWPPGMRATLRELAEWLGIDGPLLEEERTDQEIADDTLPDAETLADVPESAYTDLIVWELDTLRAVARTGGWWALLAWFDVRGIPIEPHDHAYTDTGGPPSTMAGADRDQLDALWGDVGRRRELAAVR